MSRDTGSWTQHVQDAADKGYRRQDEGYRIQDTVHSLQEKGKHDTGVRIQETRYRSQKYIHTICTYVCVLV